MQLLTMINANQFAEELSHSWSLVACVALSCRYFLGGQECSHELIRASLATYFFCHQITVWPVETTGLRTVAADYQL